MAYRETTSGERTLLDRLLSFHSNGRDGVTAKVEKYLVRELDEEGSLKFAHSAELSQPEQHKFPVEAQCRDADGIWIHALLFVVDGKVDELEIYKDDSSSIIQMPEPQDWEIFELPFS
jgi:hypothetical protein